MASILLMISIVAMGMIIFWYVFDEATRGGKGKSGLFGMHDHSEARKSEPESTWKRGGSTPWRVRRH